MNTSDSLAGNKQVFNVCCHAVNIYVKTAVLIVQCRVNQNRLFSYVYSVACKHTHHSRDTFFNSTLAADCLNHRSVEPNCLAASCVNAFAAVGTFSYDRCCGHVSCLKRMHKYLTVTVYKLCAERTNLFGNECAEYLLRICRTCRVILESVGI